MVSQGAFYDGEHIDVTTKDHRQSVTTNRILDLIKRSEYRCALTGRRLEPKDASLDHIVPVSKGGAHVMSNLQIVHKQINQAKGTMTGSEFVAMCREVVAYADLKACNAVPQL